MRAVLVTDRSFATRERSLITRVAIGLADEGVRLAIVTPEDTHLHDHAALIEHIEAPRLSPLVGVPTKARAIANQLVECRFLTEGDSVEIVHAWGDRAWALSVELARLLGSGVALDVWSMRLLSRLRAIERRAGRGKDHPELLWLAPCETIHEHVMRGVASSPCLLSPWGVHALREPAAWRQSGGPVGIALIAFGGQSADIINALTGLAGVLGETDQEALILVDEAAVRSDLRVWKAARSLKLLDRLSVIANIEARREAVLRTDMLIAPQARGEQRSILLDAMGRGITIVARSDAHNDVLIDGRTCRVVEGGEPDSWRHALKQLITDHAQSASLGESALRWVREHRPASAHIQAMLDAYEQLTRRTAGPIRFSQQAAGA